LRIAIFSESFEPVLNGVTTSIQTLRDALRDHGHEVLVFAPGFRGYRDDDPEVFRFPSFRPPTARDYPLALPWKRGLISLVRELKPDIIHTQTPFMLGWTGLRIGRRLGIPVVSTNHTQYAEYTHYFPFAPVSWSRAAVIAMLRRYYNACDLVVTPSQANKDILISYGVRPDIRVIPTANSLDIPRTPGVREEVRREWGVPADAIVLLFVGRLAREKNMTLLLDGLSRLSAEHDDLRLVVVGGGPYEEHLAREIENRDLSDRVVMTGSVPREMVGRVYCGGDLFVFPSTTDTQGLVLVEALAAGLPCIAVNAGGSPEMLRDGDDGFLCDNDAADFAAKVEALANSDDLRRTFSDRAIENSRRFGSQEMVRLMLAAYDAALSLRSL